MPFRISISELPSLKHYKTVSYLYILRLIIAISHLLTKIQIKLSMNAIIINITILYYESDRNCSHDSKFMSHSSLAVNWFEVFPTLLLFVMIKFLITNSTALPSNIFIFCIKVILILKVS